MEKQNRKFNSQPHGQKRVVVLLYAALMWLKLLNLKFIFPREICIRNFSSISFSFFLLKAFLFYFTANTDDWRNRKSLKKKLLLFPSSQFTSHSHSLSLFCFIDCHVNKTSKLKTQNWFSQIESNLSHTIKKTLFRFHLLSWLIAFACVNFFVWWWKINGKKCQRLKVVWTYLVQFKIYLKNLIKLPTSSVH